MSFLQLWYRSLLRSAAALLIAFAALTPALAELGCIEDQAGHSQAATVLNDSGHRLEKPTPAQDGEDTGSKSSTCGFSHASHGFAVPPAPCGSVSHNDAGQSFEMTLVRPLAASARDGPYHPPQA